MKNPPLFLRIKKQYQSREADRRKCMQTANEALSKSKRAIFALHRADLKSAVHLLHEADVLFVQCEKLFSANASLKEEGSFRAALEEYAEAQLFLLYVQRESLDHIAPRAMEPSVYLGGLSDCTGEIVRYAMKHVTEGNTPEASRARETVAMIIDFMLDLDLTGYLRTKFDQAKKNLRTLEEMMYELALRSK